MQNPPEGMQICPTRTDGLQALMTHTITAAECQKRQREHFHKCPTCVHHNTRNSPPVVALATPSREAQRPSAS